MMTSDDRPALEEQPPVLAVPRVWWQAQLAAWRVWLPLLGTLLLTLALILLVPVSLVERLGEYGYAGVFVLTLLSSATIIVPSPALGTAFLAGTVLNPWLVGLVGGAAAGLGETTGYIAGTSGSTLAQRSRWYPRVEHWVARWGALTVFLLAAVPSPLIDMAGIAAGTMRMRYSLYLLACMAGKIIRFIAVAWLGYWSYS
jgi:membrane protein YqaA with SNARE-associated domain